jgi:hypothetical protein
MTNTEYRKRKLAGKVRSLGSTDKCERCGKIYTVEAGQQRFCPECQPIHALEYDRDTSLPFYHEHKENINPKRNVKRRVRDNKCAWCGKEFEPINGSTTCSEECKRQHLNRYRSEWGKEVRAKHATPENAYTLTKIAKEIGRNRTTLLNWYKAGKLPEPDGYEKRGNPYWLRETITEILEEAN